MSKSKYFTDRLSKLAQETLVYNPTRFEQKYRQELIQIVNQDMNLLSELVVPIHTREWHSDPYDSWHSDEVYYYGKNINPAKQKKIYNILGVYYDGLFDDGMGGKMNDCLWIFSENKTLRAFLQKPDKNGVFECQRAIYFYKNYDFPDKLKPRYLNPDNKYNMYVDDFMECVLGEVHLKYKIRYSKKDLQNKINECCTNIVDAEIKESKKDIQDLEQQEQKAREAIAEANRIKRMRKKLERQEIRQNNL